MPPLRESFDLLDAVIDLAGVLAAWTDRRQLTGTFQPNDLGSEQLSASAVCSRATSRDPRPRWSKCHHSDRTIASIRPSRASAP